MAAAKKQFSAAVASQKKLGRALLKELHIDNENYDKAKVLDLIAQGALLEEVDKDDQTPLQLAAIHNDPDIAKALIAKGVDLDKGDWPALMGATWNAHIETMEVLIAAGAKVDKKNKEGQTALMLAISDTTSEDLLRKTRAVQILVDAGASLALKDRQGYNAMAYAEEWKRDDAVNIIETAVKERATQKKQDKQDAVMKKIEDDIRGGLKHALPPITPLSARRGSAP